MQIQETIADKLNRDKIGAIYQVLVEGIEKATNYYYGRTYGDSLDIDGKVFFTSEKRIKPGEFANVKITSTENYDLIGDGINESCQ